MAEIGTVVVVRFTEPSKAMSELEAAERAGDAAALEARRTLLEQRKVEVKADCDERVGRLREALHVS